MRTKLLLVIACLLANYLHAADSTSAKINLGIEQDFLPYATGGYFAGAWLGKGHFRVRALTARVHKPDFIIQKGFTNNHVTAYALTADYFLQKNWQGWWIAAGIVNWKSTIQSDAKLQTTHFTNWLLNGSIGYNLTLYKHVYLSPWAGLNLVVGGNRKVLVDGKTFTPALLNPEASLKVGIWL